MRAEVRAFHLAGALHFTMAAYIFAPVGGSCTERKIPASDRSPNSLELFLRRETEPNRFLNIKRNQMARIEFNLQVRNPQNGIAVNEARIDLTFPDTAVGDLQSLERAVKTVVEKAVEAIKEQQLLTLKR